MKKKLVRKSKRRRPAPDDELWKRTLKQGPRGFPGPQSEWDARDLR